MTPRALTVLTCILAACACLWSAVPTRGATTSDDPYTSPRTAWYRDAKYGMFIHWGIYAVPAGEWKGKQPKDAGEWIMHHQKIPIAEYEPLRNSSTRRSSTRRSGRASQKPRG
jgi:alpha-L-fucosidase